MRARTTVLALLLVALAGAPVAGQEAEAVNQGDVVRGGPFVFDPAAPDLILLDAPLDPGAAENLEALLYAFPGVATLRLDSSGGSMVEALAVADIVRSWELDTLVPEAARCADACFFAFAAGIGRLALGELTISFATTLRDDLIVPPESLRSIASDFLGSLGVFVDLVRLLETLDGEDSHQLTVGEIYSYGLNRRRSVGLAQIASIAPRPLLPAPSYNQNRSAGLPVRGAFFVVDANGDVVDRAITDTAWRIAGDAAAPSLLATTSLGEIGTDVSFALWPVASEARIYVGELIAIGFISTDLTSKPIDRIDTIAISTANGDLRFVPFIHARYDLSEPDVRFNNSFEIAVPALYAELVRSYYREATGFIVSFRYADGTAADLILDMGPEVAAAFRPMLELWGEPPATEAAAP